MEQIINYIKNGKGIGALIILAAAVLSTITLMITTRHFYNQVHPQIMLVAQDFLPITVEGGKIVNPVNIHKRIELNLGKNNEVFPIVLDTRQEVSQTPTEKQGLFMMRDKIYAFSPTQMRIFNWEDGIWNKQNFDTFLDYFVGIVFGVMAIICTIMLFLVYLFETWVVSVLGLLGVKVMKKTAFFNFLTLMRLSALLIAVMEVISSILNILLAFSIPGKMIFILALILEGLFIGRENTNKV